MIRSRPTSAWANRVRSPNHAATYRRAIHTALRLRGPMTREALGDLLGIPGDSLRPRVVELMRAGAVRAHGYGTTKAGNKAELLRARRAGVRL